MTKNNNIKETRNKVTKLDNEVSNTPSLINNKLNFPDLDRIEQLAIRIKNSSFAKPFYLTDKNGDYIYNEDGSHKVDIGGIIANMALGAEMGISPMAALILGKTLNANSYFSVIRGRELGLDPITSITKVYIIPTKNGNVVSTGYDVISAKILSSGGTINYIRDFETVPTYYDILGKTYIDHKLNLYKDGKLKDDFFLYIKDITKAEDIAKATKEGKIIIIQKGFTKVTTLQLIRRDKSFNETIHYSLQQATDAGLYMGINSKTGEVVDGKDNWNKHPEVHLRHRPLTILGRIGFADVLNGIYSHQEAMEIISSETTTNVDTEKDLVNHIHKTNPIVIDAIEPKESESKED